MNGDFSISIDLAPVAESVGSVINERVLPRLSQAVMAVAQQTQANWIESVMRAKLWAGEKDSYAQSIQWKMTGPFSALIWSDYRYDQEIENGRPSRDLKKMLDTSTKVRRSAEGRRYLIIPFRHNTPGHSALARAMPKAVYEIARTLKPSMIVGQTRRVSGLIASDVKTRAPLTVKQHLYRWGESLPEGHGRRLRPGNKTDPYAGMYRFQERSGRSMKSVYMTFRVMAEGSPGWIIAPRPGLHIVKGVVQTMQPLAERVFGEAMRLDMAAA